MAYGLKACSCHPLTKNVSWFCNIFPNIQGDGECPSKSASVLVIQFFCVMRPCSSLHDASHECDWVFRVWTFPYLLAVPILSGLSWFWSLEITKNQNILISEILCENKVLSKIVVSMKTVFLAFTVIIRFTWGVLILEFQMLAFMHFPSIYIYLIKSKKLW